MFFAIRCKHLRAEIARRVARRVEKQRNVRTQRFVARRNDAGTHARTARTRERRHTNGARKGGRGDTNVSAIPNARGAPQPARARNSTSTTQTPHPGHARTRVFPRVASRPTLSLASPNPARIRRHPHARRPAHAPCRDHVELVDLCRVIYTLILTILRIIIGRRVRTLRRGTAAPPAAPRRRRPQ